MRLQERRSGLVITNGGTDFGPSAYLVCPKQPKMDTGFGQKIPSRLATNTLNPTAYKQLAPLGDIVGIFFLVLGVALTTAGIGWFRRRLWGWKLAVVIIATQVLGDVVNCFKGDLLRGGIGAIIAGALLLFLLQSKVRATFA